MISCNISPASEDVADFIVRYSPRAVESLYELARTRCVNLVSQEYAIDVYKRQVWFFQTLLLPFYNVLLDLPA